MHTESPQAAVADRPWAVTSAVAGLGAVISYVLMIAAPIPDSIGVLLSAGFGMGFGAATVGLYLGVLRPVAPRTALAASALNVVAGALVVTMILVQVAIKDLSPTRDFARSLASVHLGIDVAWDLYGGVGTVLLAWALRDHPAFGRAFAIPGLLLALALLALNAISFPTPPAEAELVDLGPLVALWYVAVSVRVALLVRR